MRTLQYGYQPLLIQVHVQGKALIPKARGTLQENAYLGFGRGVRFIAEQLRL